MRFKLLELLVFVLLSSVNINSPGPGNVAMDTNIFPSITMKLLLAILYMLPGKDYHIIYVYTMYTCKREISVTSYYIEPTRV